MMWMSERVSILVVLLTSLRKHPLCWLEACLLPAHEKKFHPEVAQKKNIFLLVTLL